MEAMVCNWFCSHQRPSSQNEVCIFKYTCRYTLDTHTHAYIYIYVRHMDVYMNLCICICHWYIFLGCEKPCHNSHWIQCLSIISARAWLAPEHGQQSDLTWPVVVQEMYFFGKSPGEMYGEVWS